MAKIFAVGDRVETMQALERLTGTICNRVSYRSAGWAEAPPTSFVCVEWDSGETKYVDSDALDYEEYV